MCYANLVREKKVVTDISSFRYDAQEPAAEPVVEQKIKNQVKTNCGGRQDG